MSNARLFRYQLLVGLFIFFTVLPVVLKTTMDMDEIWGYQFARRLLYGEIPYRDFFMVVTPFAAQMNSLFLFLFSDQLLTMRWVAILMAVTNGMVIYLAAQKLQLSQLSSILAVTGYCFSFIHFPQNNYSWLALLFVSIIFLLELESSKFPLTKGIFIGLVIMTKHNIGIYVLIASILYSFITKSSTIDILKKLAGSLLICGIELFYLWRNGAIPDFIDTLIYNPIRFAQQCGVPYSNLFQDTTLITRFFAIFIPAILIILFINILLNKHNVKIKNNLSLLLLFCAVTFGFVFPISDPVHLRMALPFPLLAVSYLFNTTGSVKLLSTPFLFTITFMTLLITLSLDTMLSFSGNQNCSSLPHLKSIPIKIQKERDINKVVSYLEEQKRNNIKVYIIDTRAALYDVITGNPGSKYNTFFLGNMGKNGEEEIINEIASYKNIVVLLGPGTNPFEQQRVTNYVKNNMVYQGKLVYFKIYYHLKRDPDNQL